MTLLRLWHAAGLLCRCFLRWVLPVVGMVCAVEARAGHNLETRLSKPLRGEVKIHWQARVLAPGGAFIVYRGHGSELEEVARLAADRSGSYEVVDRAWSSGGSTYELHYRGGDRGGHLLATTAVQVEVIDSTEAAGWLAGPGLSVALPAAQEIQVRRFMGHPRAAGFVLGEDPGGEPPTPPPRRG